MTTSHEAPTFNRVDEGAAAPEVAPDAPQEAETNTTETLTADDYVHLLRQRVDRLLEAHQTLREENKRLKVDAQEAAFATYDMPSPESAQPTAEAVPEPSEQGPEAVVEENETNEKRDPRSVLRKIGDFALQKMESRGNGPLVSKLEAWGFIPLRGTRHKQSGLNFSASIARRYVKAQQNRKKRLAGFLSDEANAQLNGEAAPENPAEVEQPAEEKATSEKAEPQGDTNEEASNDGPETEVMPSEGASEANPAEYTHERAEAAAERKAARKERQPLRERASGLWQRLQHGRRNLGARALSLISRARTRAGATKDA